MDLDPRRKKFRGLNDEKGLHSAPHSTSHQYLWFKHYFSFPVDFFYSYCAWNRWHYGFFHALPKATIRSAPDIHFVISSYWRGLPCLYPFQPSNHISLLRNAHFSLLQNSLLLDCKGPLGTERNCFHSDENLEQLSVRAVQWTCPDPNHPLPERFWALLQFAPNSSLSLRQYIQPPYRCYIVILWWKIQ